MLELSQTIFYGQVNFAITQLHLKFLRISQYKITHPIVAVLYWHKITPLMLQNAHLHGSSFMKHSLNLRVILGRIILKIMCEEDKAVFSFLPNPKIKGLLGRLIAATSTVRKTWK